MGMNPLVKRLWLEALRSDEYTQAKGSLARVNQDESVSHCCLGVLCEVAIKAGVPVVKGSPTDWGAVTYGDVLSYLPEVVEGWSGIGSREGTLPRPIPDGSDLGYTLLSELNDGGEYTFAQIADVIEEQF